MHRWHSAVYVWGHSVYRQAALPHGNILTLLGGEDALEATAKARALSSNGARTGPACQGRFAPRVTRIAGSGNARFVKPVSYLAPDPSDFILVGPVRG